MGEQAQAGEGRCLLEERWLSPSLYGVSKPAIIKHRGKKEWAQAWQPANRFDSLDSGQERPAGSGAECLCNMLGYIVHLVAK